MNPVSTALPLAPTADLSISGSGDLESLRQANPQELAQEFESLFVSMLLKEMRQASGSEEGLFPGDSSDTYGGLFDMYLGRHIAQNGGIGLAASIEDTLNR